MFIVYSFIVKLPTSSSLSLNWNLGSLLAIIIGSQILSGVLLTFYYSNDAQLSFDSVNYCIMETFFGWLVRLIHFNGASFLFLVLFLHFFKGLFFTSYRLKRVWFVGILMLIIIIAESFLGYVLVWAQISFWAAVVITGLLSVIPFYGFKLIFLVWGDFVVSGLTLKFFFVLHFIVPWFLGIFIVLHLLFLHDTGSTSKLYCHITTIKLGFFPYFWFKDLYNLVVFIFFILFLFYYPFLLGDPEMFLAANYSVAPVHIVPEWYFLFAYAILRSITNKVLGVSILLFALTIFFIFLFITNYYSLYSFSNKVFSVIFLSSRVFLSWLGQCLVEYPYIDLGLLFTFLYFGFILLIIVNYCVTYFLYSIN